MNQTNEQYLHITSILNYSNDDKDKVVQLLTLAKRYKENIVDKDLFWNQLGFVIKNKDSQLISVIPRYASLLQNCCFKQQNKQIHNQYSLGANTFLA